MTRRRRRLALILVGGLLLPLFISPRVGAQVSELKSDRCTTDSDDSTPETTVASPPGLGSPTTTSKIDDKEAEGGVCGSSLGAIAPGEEFSDNPPDNYDIGHDPGGNCVCYDRRLLGLWTAVEFFVNVVFVRIGMGIIMWVLQFGFARMLIPGAERIADAFQTQIIAGIDLDTFFLFLCALWAFFLAATGKLGRAAGELGTSLVIVGLSAAVWSNPGASLTRGLEFAGGLGAEVAAVGTGVSTAGNADTGVDSTKAIGRPMARAIFETFIVRPHQLVNWGRIIPEGDKCRGVYDLAVKTGPWGTSSKPRKAMKEVGCKAEDKANRNPSLLRMATAGIVMIASALLIGLLLYATWHLIKAQLELVLSIAVWPFALACAALPGRGRTFFWHWTARVNAALAKVLVVMFALAVTVTAVSAVLEQTQTEKMLIQMLGVIVIILLAMYKLYAITKGTDKAVSQFANSMSGRSVSVSSQPWLSPSTAGFTAGALASKGAHALQTHKVNSRSAETLDLSRQRLELDKQRASTEASGFGGAYNENTVFIFNSGRDRDRDRDRDQPPPYRPRYQPPRPQRPKPIDAGPRPIPVESRPVVLSGSG